MSEGQKVALAILGAYALGIGFMVAFITCVEAFLEAIT